MADIRDILKMYALPGSSTTEDGRMLALSLAEIQTELLRLREELGKNSGVPTTVVQDIDLSGLEAAVSKLTPLPPQNLDLNPVFRSYEDTAAAIRELLGEVKTTNHRIVGLGSGGGGPSVVGLNDAQGHRLLINEDGSIPTTLTSGNVAITGPVTVTNEVEITNDTGSPIPVSGTFYQATQPVSGPLTDAQLRATSLPVSTGLSQPLTDAQLRSTPVPILITHPETDITASATVASNNAVTATLTGAASQTTYITGFAVTVATGAAGPTGLITITGTISGTLNYYISGSAAAANLNIDFSRPVPASATNTAITVNVPALGATTGAVAVTARGFRR
jgi:hypothetical protein